MSAVVTFRKDRRQGRATETSADTTPPRKALYRIPEAMALLSMSRSVIYEQIRAGRLRSVTQGRMRLIADSAIADYVELLENEAMGRAA